MTDCWHMLMYAYDDRHVYVRGASAPAGIW